MQNRPTNTGTDRPAASQTNGHQNRPSNAGTGKPAPKRINQHQNRANAAKPHLKSPKRAQQGKLQNTHTHTHTRTCTRAHSTAPPPKEWAAQDKPTSQKLDQRAPNQTKPNIAKMDQLAPECTTRHHKTPKSTKQTGTAGHRTKHAHTHTHTHTHTDIRSWRVPIMCATTAKCERPPKLFAESHMGLAEVPPIWPLCTLQSREHRVW